MSRYAVLIGLPLVLVALFIAVPWRTAAQGSRATPAAPLPGEMVTFAAGGFASAETVNYWVQSPSGVLLGSPAYAVQADAGGSATWQWRVPRGAIAAPWLMVGYGRSSGITILIEFVVTEPDERDPRYPAEVMGRVTPDQGLPGYTFSFFARAFDGSERVAYWLNAPDGTLIGDRSFNVDAEQGRAEWEWRAPEDAPPGTWRMVARGTHSLHERVLTFEIRTGQ
ncbi:MAG: hypothetical protein HC893_01620 [Chloroflexaceae bacterium]|nr:hypothetical protein [Chloroflexaceae bacterium]NJL32777.1 hypothetical protein [Chloroflexaceae bacterium]NJO04627.1 hypothetical protein [Chloroflexaceae bacterium]